MAYPSWNDIRNFASSNNIDMTMVSPDQIANQMMGTNQWSGNPAQAAQTAMQTALTSGTAIGGGPNLGTGLTGAPIAPMTTQQATQLMGGATDQSVFGGAAPTMGPVQDAFSIAGSNTPAPMASPMPTIGGFPMGPLGPRSEMNPGQTPITGGPKPAPNIGTPSQVGGGGFTGGMNQGFGGLTGNLSVSNPWNPLGVATSMGAGANPLQGGQFGMNNPNVQAMADAISNQISTNFTRNVAPSLRYGAQAAGGYGGSRQGVLEANALRDMNQTLGNSLANLYGNAYQFDVSSALQNQGMQNQFGMGLGNLALGTNTANQGFYGQQRGQDLQQAQLGANLLNQSNQGLSSIGQGLYGIGTQYQNAPWNVINQAVGGYSPFTGLGGTTTQGQPTGGGLQGLLGGFLGGAQLGRNMGWF